MSTGNFPERLRQLILVGVILVGRSGVRTDARIAITASPSMFASPNEVL